MGRGPEAFATPLDENPRAKHAIVRLKSPFSRFMPPFHAAGSVAVPGVVYRAHYSMNQQHGGCGVTWIDVPIFNFQQRHVSKILVNPV